MDNTTSFEADTTTEAEGLFLYEDWYPWMATINSLLIISGIPGNLLTIVAYCKYESLWTPTNTLIVSQSIGDLFTSLTTWLLVFSHYSLVGQRFVSVYRYACLTELSVVLIALESSATNLFALSVERFIAVYFSLEYYNWVTERSVKIAVIANWSFVLFSNSLPLFGLNIWQEGASCWPMYVHHKLQLMVCFMIPIAACLFGVSVLSIFVAGAALKKGRAYGTAALPAAFVAIAKQPEEAARRKKEQTIEFRITKMLFLVVGSLYACWFPCLVTYVLRLTVFSENGVPKVVELISEFFRGMVGFNAFLNPLIYAYKSPAFKRAFRKLLRIAPNVKKSKFSDNESIEHHPSAVMTPRENVAEQGFKGIGT